MQLEIRVISRTGGREHNEDACGVLPSPGATFCVLSDGLGGHSGGEVAARLVVRHVLDSFRAQPQCTASALGLVLHSANDIVRQEQARVPEFQDMGATVVVLALDTLRRVANWAHVGDSRLYCFRDNRIIAQTRDDSVVQEMIDAGYLSLDAQRSSPHRNKLLAALGGVPQLNPHIALEGFALKDGDAFLLCSDGLWEYVEEVEMEQSLMASASPVEWLQDLEHKVVTRGSKKQDNYSAIAVWCSDPLN